MGASLIVVGASAGGVETLSRLVTDLPDELDATIVVVLHIPASPTSVLPSILARRTALSVAPARHGDPLEPGRIYIAPPDRHVLVHDRRLLLDAGPKENGHRPAIDPLFMTAARHGEQVIGVVLSGTLDDGAAGLAAIKAHGGVAVVQDPEDALYASMPRNAIARVPVDHVVPLAQLAALLERLVSGEDDPPPPDAANGDAREPARHAEAPGGELDANQRMREHEASGLSCPECGGSLWVVGHDATLRFRCRIGHAYSEQSLMQEQGRSLEVALWTAMRALEERAALLRRMGRRAREAGRPRSATRFEQDAAELDEQAAVVRGHVVPAALKGDAGAVAGG
jgi:two-component system chemotaxis response regulator CheB